MVHHSPLDLGFPELVLVAREGSTSAFDELMRRCRTEILGLLSGHALRPYEIDETFQEVVIRVHTALPTLRHTCRFHSWIRQIAYYACVDRIRRQHAQKRTLPLDDDPPDRRAPEPGALAARDAEHLLPALVAEIAGLKPKPASALLLRVLEGLTYNEIAHRLGISLPCVKTYLHRTRLHLRNRLAVPAEAGYIVRDWPGRRREPP